MMILSVAPVLVAALAAEVALAAPAGVADVPEVTQGPSVKQSVKTVWEFTTHMPIPLSAMSALSAHNAATHIPVPTSAVTAENHTNALEFTDGIEARAKDQVCDAFLDCALSPPEPKTTMVAISTPLPTVPPPGPTISSSVVPALTVGPPVTALSSYGAYCWEADNGQVHCVWTAPNRLAKRTDAPEPTAGSLIERVAVAVPTTLVTAVKREADAAEQVTGGPRLPYFTRAA